MSGDASVALCPSSWVIFLQLHADAEHLGYQQCEEAFTQRVETIYHSIPETVAYKEERHEHQEYAT
jgi:hypothetical protein